MKVQSIFNSRMTAVTCGIVLATSFAFADEWDKRTVLTVDQPIQITDTYLAPGTYVLKLVSSNSDRHIVQIFNSDETQVLNTVLAIPNYRLEPTGRSQFLFWETPPGTARAMRAWFYPGDNFGQEFRYPKTLKQLTAMAKAAPAPAPAPEPAPAVAMNTPEPAPEPEQHAAEEQVIIAQNTAPAPPVQEVQAAPEEQPIPQELPKTGSPFPLIGLGGLLSLAFYGLLKVTHTA
jgi:hypothetical protein